MEEGGTVWRRGDFEMGKEGALERESARWGDAG